MNQLPVIKLSATDGLNIWFSNDNDETHVQNAEFDLSKSPTTGVDACCQYFIAKWLIARNYSFSLLLETLLLKLIKANCESDLIHGDYFPNIIILLHVCTPIIIRIFNYLWYLFTSHLEFHPIDTVHVYGDVLFSRFCDDRWSCADHRKLRAYVDILDGISDQIVSNITC